MITSKGSNGSKRLRRILISALSFVLALAIAVPAFAATITITNGRDGEEYKAYKLLDATSNGSNGYNYTTSNETLVEILRECGYTADYVEATGLYYVSLGSANGTLLTQRLYALYMDENYNFDEVFGSPRATIGSYSSTNNTLNLYADENDDGAGYYFVTSSLGSLCMLNTSISTQTINEKNEEASVTKTVSDTEGVIGNDELSAQIGDTVYFTVEITVPENTESLKLSDTLSNGLTLDTDSFTYSINDGEYSDLRGAATINTPGENNATFSVDLTGFLDDMVFTVNESASESEEDEDDEKVATATITIKYSAKVNENAVNIDPETNKAVIDYGESSSSEDTSSVYTYYGVIKKTDDSGNSLNGAVFQLMRGDADSDPIYVIPLEDDDGDLTGDYRVATQDEIDDEESGATTFITVNGEAIIYGLDLGYYYLNETDAPDGYNLLTEPYELEMTENGTTAQVLNYEGTILPSSGGIGTTIIYIVGALLVVGAGAALYVRHRKA